MLELITRLQKLSTLHPHIAARSVVRQPDRQPDRQRDRHAAEGVHACTSAPHSTLLRLFYRQLIQAVIQGSSAIPSQHHNITTPSKLPTRPKCRRLAVAL